MHASCHTPDWLASLSTPPQPRVTQGDIRMVDYQFYVLFMVEHTGGDTAERVQVIAEVR